MKHILTYIIVTLLIISTSSALIVENPLPKITTTFNEPIIISSLVADLKDINNNSIYIDLINLTVDNKTIQHQPIDYLQEGNYYFTIQAEDIYGNQGDIQTQPFTLTVPPLSISLHDPRFAISPINPFDIIIETTLPSDCRYAYVPKSYENMNTYLTTSDDFYHTLADFNLGSVNTIYFACFSSYKNETSSKDFTFSIDSSVPKITSIHAEDVAELPLETDLIIHTDSKTVCAYHKNSTTFSEMILFDDLDEEDITSYKTSHTHLLDANDLKDLTTNTFFVICKNLAGTFSQTKTISIDVSSQSEAIVTINSPKANSYHSAGSVILNLTTNKLAKCHFSNNPDEITGSGETFGTFTKKHETTLSLNAGSFTYYFQCLVNTPEGLLDSISTQFIVDATPPNLVYVDDSSIDSGLENLSEFTYFTDQLFVEIYAVDNESGIFAYNYSIWQDNSDIFEPDTIIFNWTILESDDSLETSLVKDLKLLNGKKYYFKARVENGAHLWSLEKTSNGITVNSALGNLGYCYNNLQDGIETDIDCGGICPQCPDQSSCLVDSDCQSNFCDPLTKLCKSSSTCSNGRKDGTESDIDCGGQCENCIFGQSCYINSDCQSNFCDPSTKLCIASNTCNNNILDVGESDIDCGGSCPTPCASGKQCITDFDCQSGYCADGLCAATNKCNNGQFDLGEQCDTETDITCSLFELESGTISCTAQCSIDTSLCIGGSGICGDNIINPGEQCDGSNLGNANCYDFGEYQSGQLACQDCQLIMDRCTTKLNPSQDTDNDGMSDACELKYFNCRTCADPDEDPDEDKLINKEECLLCGRQGTDPNNPDTDGDGYSDYKEKNKGTSPCDSEDYPSSPLLPILIISFILLVLAGFGYYLYKKGSLITTKEFPYIKLKQGIKSFNDLFNPPQPQQEINHEHYMPPQQERKQEQPSQQQIQQTKQIKQDIKKKQLSIRKTLRERKRSSTFESFKGKDKSFQIKKLSKLKKPIKKLDSKKQMGKKSSTVQEKPTTTTISTKEDKFSSLPHSKSKKKLFKK